MLAFLFPAIRGMENAAAVFRAVRVFGGRGSGGGAGGGDGDDDMRPELNAALQAEMLTHTARPQTVLPLTILRARRFPRTLTSITSCAPRRFYFPILC